MQSSYRSCTISKGPMLESPGILHKPWALSQLHKASAHSISCRNGDLAHVLVRELTEILSRDLVLAPVRSRTEILGRNI